jgi:hypothetical protein
MKGRSLDIIVVAADDDVGVMIVAVIVAAPAIEVPSNERKISLLVLVVVHVGLGVIVGCSNP